MFCGKLLALVISCRVADQLTARPDIAPYLDCTSRGLKKVCDVSQNRGVVNLLQVQIHGGNVTDTITADTTHLVVEGPDLKDEQGLKPLALMQAVSGKLGGLQSLCLFKQSMLSGRLKIVCSRCHSILRC